MSTHEDLNEYKPMAYIFLNKAIFHEKTIFITILY